MKKKRILKNKQKRGRHGSQKSSLMGKIMVNFKDNGTIDPFTLGVVFILSICLIRHLFPFFKVPLTLTVLFFVDMTLLPNEILPHVKVLT